MHSRPYKVVDVFTAVPYCGNPLAVVVDSAGLDTARMQRFAHWTNLSETTFLLPPTDPDADYQVRIFTPARELPFAGHPTLGSCHAWLAAGGRPRRGAAIVQQCGLGLVQLRRDGDRLAFQAPALSEREIDGAQLDAILSALGIGRERVRQARSLQNGPRWLSLLLDSARTVLELEPDHGALARVGLVGVIGPQPAGGETDMEVRAFAASDGINEDPVTGSLNAALGQWLIGAGLAPEKYRVAQGTKIGRAGRVEVARRDGGIWIGGAVSECVAGSVTL
jgi:PhzF family phenazine biosynthesis protein